LSPGRTVHTAALAALEMAIEQALRLDPATRKALGSLDGKCLHLYLYGPNLDFYVLPSAEGLALKGMHDDEANTSVNGTPADFIELIAADDAAAALINGNIQLTGDSRPLLELQSILHSLELDWEGELARLVGDMPAHELGRFVRQGLKIGRSIHASLLRQLEEFIHEEGRLLPPRAELDVFYSEVDELVQRAERLAARVTRLEQS
jgi:ubiquinone biosynthesis protein UbiJ